MIVLWALVLKAATSISMLAIVPKTATAAAVTLKSLLATADLPILTLVEQAELSQYKVDAAVMLLRVLVITLPTMVATLHFVRAMPAATTATLPEALSAATLSSKLVTVPAISMLVDQ